MRAGSAPILRGECENQSMNAGLESGAPGFGAPAPTHGARHLGWYSRGYLPHYDVGNIYQSITYRLADSMPKSKLDEWKEEYKHLKEKDWNVIKRKKIEAWLNTGYGSCLLQHASCAQLVIDAWKYFDNEHYHLIAWVVMPNHVHVLVYIKEGFPLGQVVGSWKRYTSRRIKQLSSYRSIHNRTHPMRTISRNEAQNDHPEKLWQRGYWDRFIRDENHFNQTVEYIENNPVAAGLVGTPEAWMFSSAYDRMSEGRSN